MRCKPGSLPVDGARGELTLEGAGGQGGGVLKGP